MLSRVLTGRARPAGWLVITLAVLAAGYLDLARGGTTAAAVLLTLGYCALAPLAIRAVVPERPRTALPRGGADERPPYAWAALAAAAVLALYVATLAPSTSLWDTSEYITAARVLGLPHPPGNPLFVLAAHAFGLLPLSPDYATRINLMIALASAVAAGCWFLVAHQVLATFIGGRWRRLAGASAATLIGATAFTVWNQSVVAEKVYMVSLAIIAVVSWIAVRWCHAPDDPRADRRVVLAAYLAGLGYAVHPAGFLVLPALGVAVAARRPTLLLRWRLWLVAACALALGVTPFAMEPIRAGHFPSLNEGEPTGCLTRFAWSCTFDHVARERLRANIAREQYAKPPVAKRQAPFGAQMATWWMYFRWQWLRDAYGEHAGTQLALALVFLALGLLGARAHWRHDPASFAYVAPLVLTLTVALVFYLNFKYGWSQSPALGDAVPREVRDRDYFYVWSFSLWGVWAGLGLADAWRALALAAGRAAGAARRDRDAEPSRAGWAMAAPVLALAVLPLAGNARQAPRAGQTFTLAWAHDLLDSVEPYAILITGGDNDTFPLWYAQQVEGIRRDVTVVVTSYLGTDWFVRQLLRRPVAAYDASRGPAIYRGREWKRPDHPPLDLTFAEADAVPAYVELGTPARFQQGSLVATIAPGYLGRDQILVLRFIKDSFPERPIYFSLSAGGYPRALGLGPYLLEQGLAQKLVPAPLAERGDTVAVAGSFVDRRRTLALWDSVYRAPRAVIGEDGWVDRASAGLPMLYAVVGVRLADALAAGGDTARAERVVRTVARVASAARLGDLFGTERPAPPPRAPAADGPVGVPMGRESGSGNRE
ncbi:MAG TPA: DUF2723 domain-containing protein [Gemmatimonadaceae bacterium]